MTSNASLGQRVRALREKHGYTQKELASSARCEQTLVSRIETRDGYDPGVFTLYRVAKALGTSIDALLEGVVSFTPAAIIKTTGAPPEMVARMGEEIAVLHKTTGQIVDTLADLGTAVKDLKAEVRSLKTAPKKQAVRR